MFAGREDSVVSRENKLGSFGHGVKEHGELSFLLN